MTDLPGARPARLRRPGQVPDASELEILRQQRAAVLDLCDRADQGDDPALLAFVAEVRTALGWLGDDLVADEPPTSPLADHVMAAFGEPEQVQRELDAYAEATGANDEHTVPLQCPTCGGPVELVTMDICTDGMTVQRVPAYWSCTKGCTLRPVEPRPE